MIIEKIVFRDKDSVVIYLEGKEKYILSLNTLVRLSLYKEKQLTKEELEEIKGENSRYSAYISALRLLARRAHSIGELRDKLKLRKHEKKVIDSVVQELSYSGYLNDLDFAQKYALELLNIKCLGKNAIKSELIKKKISRTIIEDVLKELIKEEQEKENIELLALKKYKMLTISEHSKIKNNPDLKKIKSKLYNYLMSKGFNTELILETVNLIIKHDDNSEFE